MTSAAIPRLAPECSADDIDRELDEWGCCVIDEYLPPETMNEIVTEMTPYAQGATMGVGAFEGIHTRRTGNIVARSETYRSIARADAVLAAGNHVLGHASSWILSAVELIEIYPGQPMQMLHRDEWKYDFLELPVEVEMNGMWALTDFTEENGATRVVPGSHKWPHDRRAKPHESVAAEMPKGSLFLYTGRVFHGGGENQSDAPRAGLSIQHCVGWATQSEMIMLECLPEMVADWDEELARFIGYQRRSNALGYYRDSEDPLAAVHPDRDYGQGWISDATKT
jgi:ectoine hydroxylase-related dioxygenase (phytanoyl-CoA dioxygenase family)